MKIHVPAALAVLALLLAASAGATDIYKYEMPDGSVLYSQEKLRNATPRSVIHVTPPTAQERAARRSAERRLQQQIARADRLEAQRSAQSGNDNELRIAAQSYPVLPATTAPLPGERQAIAGGGSRLNEAYWARMGALGIVLPDQAAQPEPPSGMLLAK